MRRALCSLLAAAALAPAAAPAGAAPVPTGCPRSAPLALPASGAKRSAERAAIREAPSLYRGVDLHGVRATRVVRASSDRDRGGYAAKCGRSVRGRSIVVYLEFPAELPSSSLGHGVVLVARFRHGFRVWALLH